MSEVIQNLPRIFLVVGALAFIYYGFLGLANPVKTVADLEISIATNPAKTEIRATYGGLLLGIGLVLAYTAFAHPKLGLIAVILMMSSIGFTRLYGIFADDSKTLVQWQLLAMELPSALIAAVLLLIFYSPWRSG